MLVSSGDSYGTFGVLFWVVWDEVLGYRPAGFYTGKERSAYWNGRNEAGESVASGVYFYSILAGKELSETRKMVILR